MDEAATINSYQWIPSWYCTRSHAVPLDVGNPQDRWHTRGLCSAFVQHEPAPSEWRERRIERGVPKCKKCLRKMGVQYEQEGT